MLREFGQILNKTFHKNYSPKGGSKVDALLLLQNWENIVGPKLIKVSLPQRIFKKTLYIVVNHSAYAHHLNQIWEQILQKIEKHYPKYTNKIEKLRFIYSEKAFEEIQERVNLKQKSQESALSSFNPRDPKYRKLLKEAEEMFKSVPADLKPELISIFIQSKMNH